MKNKKKTLNEKRLFNKIYTDSFKATMNVKTITYDFF